MTQRQMHLGAAIAESGTQRGAWMHPEGSAHLPSFDQYLHQARVAEAACLDFIFMADGLTIYDRDHLRHNPTLNELEPLTTMTALATHTSKIGLVATVSTSYSEPFNVARMLSTLDHVSAGRASWNIVTSVNGGANFGQASEPLHAARYERAHAYLEVITALWDSWEDDAKITDFANRIYADISKIHDINVENSHFSVRGPLNASRSPQGRPVLVQAGSSDSGIEFGSRWGEVIFTAQSSVADGVEFATKFRNAVRKVGRDPQSVAILPGIAPVAAATEAEAQEKYRSFDDLVDPRTRINAVEKVLHVDLSEFDLDDTIPEEMLVPVETIEGRQSRYAVYRRWAVEDKRTIREIARPAMSSDGHWLIVGSGEQIADAMIERFEAGAADGFNLVPLMQPGTLDGFAEHVVPVLQERGYFRTEYREDTLRERLGLERPASQFAAE